MDFQSAISYLDNFLSYEQERRFIYDEKNFDLGRLREFLMKAKIDYSKLKFVHVAGSKGKGTVATLIANYLSESGFKTGLFTSPHIVTIRERFWLDGEYISESDFARYVSEVQRLLNELEAELTHFEILFVISLMFFLEKNVDYAVIEVGLGGRLDATNVIMPVVSVLTIIEKEHTEILGETIQEILNEKLGIKKDGVPLVVADQSEEVKDLIRERNFEDVIFVEGRENFATAKVALGVVLGQVDDELFERAAEKFKLPGRFDLREVDGHTVIFDMAHTEKSVEKLIEDLRLNFPEKEFVFLVSVMKGKKVAEILALISKVAEKIFFTSSHEQRGYSGQELSAYAKGEICEDCHEAFQKILKTLKKDQVLVVTGSHFLLTKLLI